MTWVLVDDKVRNHPKVLAAGPLAAWQWVAGLGYASEFLTDGFIPKAALRALVPNQPHKTTLRLAEVLVDVGLWERADGGYRIHDYHDYQPTAARVREKRDAAKARKDAWKERTQNANGTRSSGVPNASGTRLEQAPIPSHPIPTEDLTASYKASGVEPAPDRPPGQAEDEAQGEHLTPQEAAARVKALVAQAARAAPGPPPRAERTETSELTLGEAIARGRRMAGGGGSKADESEDDPAPTPAVMGPSGAA